jgi:hypothetical protein
VIDEGQASRERLQSYRALQRELRRLAMKQDARLLEEKKKRVAFARSRRKVPVITNLGEKASAAMDPRPPAAGPEDRRAAVSHRRTARAAAAGQPGRPAVISRSPPVDARMAPLVTIVAQCSSRWELSA